MSKEAMKLALEALKQSQQILDEYMTECVAARQANMEAIKALEAALAKQEHDKYDEVAIAYGFPKQEQVEWVCDQIDGQTSFTRSDAVPITLEQPKQKQGEPVALDVTIEGDNAILLYDFLGEDRDELSPLRLVVGKGHSGYGLYVAQADYQDEGAVLVTSITPPLAKQEQGEIERLIAALKKANEQAEHFEREWYLRGDELEKLKQEQGEPVAQCCSAGIAHDCHAGDGCRIVERIKSTPQPAQKPLTDEQIKSIWRLAVLEAAIKGNATANFARAIEAAHNIKE